MTKSYVTKWKRWGNSHLGDSMSVCGGMVCLTAVTARTGCL